MTLVDSMSLAAEAGLLYVGEEMPGLRRIRRGRGFSYVGVGGETVNGPIRERIESLVIPPAWEDVWISADPSGHIQATGYDKAGRKQYIYHPVWEQVRDEAKFERMGDFGRRVAKLRRRLDSDLRRPGLAKEKVAALAVSVMDLTLIRVGNQRYAEENEAYGLTTLTGDHVEIDGFQVHLEFAGKGGADHQLAFRDRRLASLIARCQELAGQTLFGYETEQGVTSISSTDVNSYLAQVMSAPFTAKDFRTWGASTAVAELLVADNPAGDEEAHLLRAIDATAEKLGNTREVCRSSYLHPLIPEAFRDGSLRDAWSRSRRGPWLGRAEAAVNRLMATPTSDDV
jgi:DNA topoisomerase-1